MQNGHTGKIVGELSDNESLPGRIQSNFNHSTFMTQRDLPPIHLPLGFRFSGVVSGIKASGNRDVSLVVGDGRLVAAGVYTQNQIVAAPVVWCRQRTPGETIRAVVTNSGNANACTGPQGDQDTADMCNRVAQHLGCPADDVLVMSTGVIGQNLPMDNVNAGIDDAYRQLGSDEQSFLDSSDGILTTDKSRKIATRKISIGGESVTVAAMAKGAGMIAPNMATMLAVVTTDAKLSTDQAQRMITDATRVSFNSVSVDGHTSTSDTLLLLASGKSGPPIDGEYEELLAATITEICIELAKMLIADGEGASHWMAIEVRGAESDEDANLIARTVGASQLVKTAITGGDPNWGRIISAAGYAGPKIDPSNTSLAICDTAIYQSGAPVPFDAAKLSEKMKSADEVLIELTVGKGEGAANFWASDLTTEYVRFNSEYTT